MEENKQDRIVFMGTPRIAADVLQSLLDAGANVVLAVTQPDKKIGRKHKVTPCEVKVLAQQHNIPVFQPEKIRSDYQQVLDAKPDLIVTCAYGQIVPTEVLDAPRVTAVNLHGSILPAYRGSAPIQRAIQDGLTETGMSLMEMEAGMDCGGVMDVATVDITNEDNMTSMFDKMGKLAGQLIVDNLDTLLYGNPVFKPQNHEQATMAPKILKDEEKIDLSMEDHKIFNHIRALSEVPGAYVLVDNKKLKLLKADYVPNITISSEVQEISNDPVEQIPLVPGLFEAKGKKGLFLQLHNGRLDLKKVQLEGKPAMEIKDFMNGQGRGLAGKKAD